MSIHTPPPLLVLQDTGDDEYETIEGCNYKEDLADIEPVVTLNEDSNWLVGDVHPLMRAFSSSLPPHPPCMNPPVQSCQSDNKENNNPIIFNRKGRPFSELHTLGEMYGWKEKHFVSEGFRTSNPKENPDNIQPFHHHMSLPAKLSVINEIGSTLADKLMAGQKFAFVDGVTGSGKSTLVPLSLLITLFYANLEKFYMAVPRRAAADRLYQYLLQLASQLDLPVNSFGLKYYRRAVNYNRAKFVVGTAGHLGMRLVHRPEDIYKFGVIILDEVHELQLDTDILIGILKSESDTHVRKYGNIYAPIPDGPLAGCVFPNIVLLSATLPLENLYAHFRPEPFFRHHLIFERPSSRDVTLTIPPGANSGFSVRVLNLEDLRDELGMYIENVKEEVKPHIMPSFLDCQMQLILETLSRIHTDDRFLTYRNGLHLLCLPGTVEMNALVKYHSLNSDQFSIPFHFVKFHGLLTPEQLSKAEDEAKHRNGMVSILMATSITDSSITLNNCSVVLDSGLTKLRTQDEQLRKDKLNKFYEDTSLSVQRKGRTGRTCDGLYIRFLSSQETYPPISPDLGRICIDHIVQRILKMRDSKIGKDEHNFVTKFFTSHLYTTIPEEQIQQAFEYLLNCGLVTRQVSNNTNNNNDPDNSGVYDNFHLTYIGNATARNQTSPHHIRACVFTSLVGCFDSMMNFAAVDMEDQQRRFFVQPTADLHLWCFLNTFSFAIPSDFLLISQIVRLWRKSSTTRRVDGNDKQVPATSVLSHLPRGCNREATDQTFHGCTHGSFDWVDDNCAEISDNMTGFSMHSGQAFAVARTSRQKVVAMIQDKLNEQLAFAITSNPLHRFESTPSTKYFEPTKYKSTNLLDTVFLRPAPPIDSDIREYGPFIQLKLGRVSGLLPSLFVNREMNRLEATFPPSSTRPWMGSINIGVKMALAENAFNIENFAFSFHFTPIPIDQSLPENRTKTEFGSVDKRAVLPRITSTTKFTITTFRSPHNFGVRRCGDSDEFMQISHALFNIKDKLTKNNNNKHYNIPLERIVTGQQIIFYDDAEFQRLPPKSRVTTYWNQHVFRAKIISTLTPTRLSCLNPEALKDEMVAILLIDVGITVDTTIQNMYLYEEASHNYNLPNLFDLPPQGYRVILSTLFPDCRKEWAWNGNDVADMTAMLKSNVKGSWHSRVRLDVQYVSENRRIIQAKDIYPQSINDGTSFVQWCLNNSLAQPVQDITFVNPVDIPPSRDFIPSPTNLHTTLGFRERASSLKSRASSSTIKHGSRMDMWTFTEMYSPLEVDFIPIYQTSNSQLQVGNGSLNVRPMDPRLSSHSARKETYDPLLCITGQTWSPNGSKELFKTNNVTILPPIPAIVPLVEMIIAPVIQLIFNQSNQFRAVRLYRRTFSTDVQFYRCYEMPLAMDETDLSQISELRRIINLRHLKADADCRGFEMYKILLDYVTARRPSLDLEPLSYNNFPHPVVVESSTPWVINPHLNRVIVL